MKSWSLDLRRRVVEAYQSGLTGTYEETAKMFNVGVATVNRWLRRKRESGDVIPLPRGGSRRPRLLDLDWLRRHAEEFPDARLRDRVDAWEAQSGIRVHIDTVSTGMHKIGWTYKKKRPQRVSAINRKSKPNKKPSKRNKQD